MAKRLTPHLRRPRPCGSSGLGALVLAISVLVTSPARAGADPLDGPRTRIELGYRDSDLAVIESARADLLILASTGDRDADPASAAYYAAYARFRQALASVGDRTAARGYLEDCITELRVVVAQRPAYAEARALLGSCYGMSTFYDVLTTMTRGLEARRQMNEARRLAPDNPWVVMQDGLADWATPRLFGGDRSRALLKLERAAGLFATTGPVDSRFAAWGAAEAWQQLALRYRELGRDSDAALAFDRASAVSAGRLQVATLR
ncbi:MAG: hypothetical protein ABIX37_10100 [Gammaproteobacteria bacterium]